MNKFQRFSTTIMAIMLLVAFVENTTADIALGVKGGMSLASLKLTGDVDPSVSHLTRTGLALCVNFEVSLNSGLWLRIEPMYVEKGSEVDWPSEVDELDNVQEYEYLTVPVNLKAVYDLRTFRPFIFAGPNIGYALKTEAVIKNDGTVVDMDLRDFDLALDFGGGTEIACSTRYSIVIEARYLLGLTDISKLDYSSIKNRAALVLAGVNFTL